MDFEPHKAPLARILGRTAIAIGVFDGVHLGHQMLIQSLVKDAVERTARPVVVTFERDPDELFCPERVHKLLSNPERIAALEHLVADVLALPFDPELAALSWREFLDTILALLPGLQSIHVGDNFRLGARATGGIPELEIWGAEHDISVTAHPLLLADGKPVSSSRIRTLLAKGDVVQAAVLLTRPFVLTGQVVAGAGRGTGLGFATANVAVDGAFADMGAFVYAAYAYVGDECYKAAVSIGEPPTFSPESGSFNPLLLEAHLLDFDSDIYGGRMRLEFIKSLRPMQRFASQEELIATVQSNINWVRENL